VQPTLRPSPGSANERQELKVFWFFSSEKNKSLLFLKKKKQKDFNFLVLFCDACPMIPRRGFLQASAAATLAAPAAGVTLVTPYGPILVACDIVRAPLSAHAFLACVDAHAYDGGAFTRVVRPDNDHGHPVISVVQGAARPGTKAPAIAHESTRQTGLRHLDGTISLPRDAVGTATGAEIFICVGDQPALDCGARRNPDAQGFAAFGRVTSGMDIVRRIWRMNANGPSADAYTKGQMLLPPVPILHGERLP
jgi:peptidyl-prolyl cis-trans isomerase A (cyclophilin A)